MVLTLPTQFDDTLGALYVGNIAGAILFGAASLQTYLYFSHYPKDAAQFKALIAFLWVLNAFHLALTSHAFYYYSITNFVKPEALVRIEWSLVGQVITSTVSDSLVRAIFGRRVWRLSGGNIPTIVIIILSSIFVVAGSILFSIRSLQAHYFTEFNKLSWILYMSLAAIAWADIVIAVPLCVFLKRHETVFKRTRSVIRMLILYSINGSALTSICAFVCLATYATMPHNFIFQAIYFLLPNLYINSLLATLNARHKLREHSSDLISIPLSRITSDGVSGDATSRDRAISIHINQITHTDHNSLHGDRKA